MHHTMIPFPSYYHLSTLQPRAPIASIIAIDVNTDSDGFTAAMVAVNTVHRPRLPSGDDIENK